MRLRLFAGLLMMVALVLPAAVRAEDNTTPSIVLRVKSIDGLLKDAKYLAELAGQGEQLKQVEQMIKDFSTETGLGGIDTKKPLGLYGNISPGLQDSPIVVLIPIADEKAFLQFLGSFEIKPVKGDDGVYTIDNIPNAPLPVSLYFRFHNGYAHITVNDKVNIDKDKLLPPEKALGGEDSAISLKASIADLPDILKQIALTQIENMLAQAKEMQEGEPPAVTKAREQSIDFVGKQIKAILDDGESLTLRANVDQSKEDVVLEMAFKAKEGSQLAKDMIAAGKGQSRFASLASPTDAISMIGHYTFPEELNKVIVPAVDDLIKQITNQEMDEVKKALAKAALDKLAPTLKAGILDAGLSLRGPNKDGHYTAVGGLTVKEGKGIEAFLKDTVKNLPENERQKVTLDVAKAGDATIHKVVIDDMDEETKKVVGSTTMYIAISDTVVLVGLGPDAQEAVKSAASAQAGTAPLFNFSVSVARASGLNKNEANAEQVAKAIKEVFGAEPKGNDTVSLTAEMGQTLSVRLKMKAKVVAFGAKAGIAAEEKIQE